MLEKPRILNHFLKRCNSESPSLPCNGEDKAVQSGEIRGMSWQKESLDLLLASQIPVHHPALPPQGEMLGRKWEGYQEEKWLNPLSPLSLTARVQIMLFFSHHNNIVIQLGSTRWSE